MSGDIAPPRRRRSWWIVAIVAAAVFLVGAGWWSASAFQSPAQREADATAPSPAPVYAEVVQGSLVEEHAFTGIVSASVQTSVTLQSPQSATVSVVTGHPVDAGDSVPAGDVLTEVNGRPVLLVRSDFAFYRDMGAGDEGPDVRMLQAALVERGYGLAVDGRFGATTGQVVAQWYRDKGYSAPTRSTGGSADAEEPPADEPDAPPPTAAVPAPEPYVPVAEILGVTSRDVRVIEGVRVGDLVAMSGSADLVLGTTEIVVSVSAPASQLADIAEGDAVTISVGTDEVEGTVGTITQPTPADATGATSDGGGGSAGGDPASDATFVVIPKSALKASPGDPARVTAARDVVTGEALLVPVLAVTDRGGDTTVVAVRQEDGSLTEVPVTVLGSLQGQVAVEPDEPDSLVVGDQVRVG